MSLSSSSKAFSNPTTEKPFVIELEQLDRTPDGHFRPHASLKLTPALRMSGLLRSLPPEDVAWLTFLLTFLSPNGECRAHLESLSEAMRVSRQKVEKRMAQLASFRWQGEPIITMVHHDSGLLSYTLSPNLISYWERRPASSVESLPTGGFADAIIARSRETYGHPRAEVEQMIEAQYRHRNDTRESLITQDDSSQELRQKLENVGVALEQAEYLLRSYDSSRIERQLEWLPYRNAKNPAGFLMAAIEGDYEEPLSLRFLGLPHEMTVNSSHSTQEPMQHE